MYFIDFFTLLTVFNQFCMFFFVILLKQFEIGLIWKKFAN
jgi:hypothetical protein